MTLGIADINLMYVFGDRTWVVSLSCLNINTKKTAIKLKHVCGCFNLGSESYLDHIFLHHKSAKKCAG